MVNGDQYTCIDAGHHASIDRAPRHYQNTTSAVVALCSLLGAFGYQLVLLDFDEIGHPVASLDVCV
jgi:hypothetical protein